MRGRVTLLLGTASTNVVCVRFHFFSFCGRNNGGRSVVANFEERVFFLMGGGRSRRGLRKFQVACGYVWAERSADETSRGLIDGGGCAIII